MLWDIHVHWLLFPFIRSCDCHMTAGLIVWCTSTWVRTTAWRRRYLEPSLGSYGWRKVLTSLTLLGGVPAMPLGLTSMPSAPVLQSVLCEERYWRWKMKVQCHVYTCIHSKYCHVLGYMGDIEVSLSIIAWLKSRLLSVYILSCYNPQINNSSRMYL